MKLKKKKSLIAILVLFLVIGVTIAYYTSTTVFENVFNTGTYKIVTTETFESPSNWAPGQEIPKTITSTNEGTVPAAVRVSYVEKWEDLQGNDITSQVSPNPAIINLDNTSEWIQEGNYYYYKYILNPNETTSSFMKSVTLDPTLNGVTCTGSGNTRTCEGNNPATGAKYKLTITKETVQADKYDTVWNTEVEITVKNSGSSSNEQGNGGQSSSVPTIASCPGCTLFAYTTNSLTIGTSTAPDDATPDYTTLTEHPYFLGFITNSDTGVIERAFACGIEGTKPFCIEGNNIEKYYDGTTSATLSNAFPGCNTTINDNWIACTGSTVSVQTNGRGNGYVSMGGYAVVGDNNYACNVLHTGRTGCFGW